MVALQALDDKKPANLMRDPRVRALPWRDLLPLTRLEIAKELLISSPWLIGSLVLAYFGLYILALPLSFIFFLTGLRQVHDAHHYALGISHRATEWVMFTLSFLMQSSMHAVQVTHLHHHKHCMDPEDVEASSARMSGIKAIVFGPIFPIMVHTKAYQLAPTRRRIWIVAEILTIAAWVLAAIFLIRIPWITYHVCAMAVGQCMTAYFAVWTVHHGCDGQRDVARTIRSKLKSFIVFDMFFHVEHHLFPQVPTCHLSHLAKRLDTVAPQVGKLQVY